MRVKNTEIPSQKELEREINEYLSRKYGDRVRVISAPFIQPKREKKQEKSFAERILSKINFDLKPQELIAYLDQYVVKQEAAKAILATKICTHFNRIKYWLKHRRNTLNRINYIKNNILMIGPTGVGKTFMIKLIAQKLGVPFVKGDATKFSETGYVGGDIEDLVRELVHQAEDDIELAQFGIIYIDEIDKIASSNSFLGPDVSRTGVQRALLKPMEETEVDLKTPFDPISQLETIEQYRRTGKKERLVINTRHILFIMSGAFNGLEDIVKQRIHQQEIGFGANITSKKEKRNYLAYVKAEDLIKYGFESEFIGRLPVIAVFEKLETEDLYQILKNPNSVVINAKKQDFRAYDIDLAFEDQAFSFFAQKAAEEGTGARALVSVLERTLLPFEKTLPSTEIKKLVVTREVATNPKQALCELLKGNWEAIITKRFEQALAIEAEVTDWINVAVVPIFEVEEFYVDEGHVTLGPTESIPLYLKSGLMYYPFGKREEYTHFPDEPLVNLPFTMYFGEIWDPGAVVGFTKEIPGMGSLTLEGFAVYAKVTDSDNRQVDTYGFNVCYNLTKGDYKFEIGASSTLYHFYWFG